VPVNIGNSWVLEDFIIVNMPETNDAQIILGRPLLATVGCQIDATQGRMTFEVEGCYAMFCHMKEKVASPNSPLLDEFHPSPKIVMEDVLDCEDPLNFD